MTRRRVGLIFAVLTTVLTLSAAPSYAAKPQRLDAAAVDEVQRAIDEQRLTDASRMLGQLQLAGVTDPRLALLGGRLSLARGQYGEALTAFKMADTTPATRAAALEGQGLALSMLGRSDDAVTTLNLAVAANPDAWRAWNALGREYDGRSQWAASASAYEKAMAASGGAAIVLNNRGYSSLLQQHREAAVTDLVAALAKKPDLAEARTNLRLALAMQGDYSRAVAGGLPGDQASLLNNAGFAAAMRGDYPAAEDFLQRAIAAKGEYYERASENLKIVRALAARTEAPARAAP